MNQQEINKSLFIAHAEQYIAATKLQDLKFMASTREAVMITLDLEWCRLQVINNPSTPHDSVKWSDE